MGSDKMEHKYIDADALLLKLRSDVLVDVTSHLEDAIADMPAADVEPVRKWISVDELLPEEAKDVLVWYEYDGLYEVCGVGYQAGGTWVGKFNGKDQKIIAWMPLPEALKMDGGSE